MVRNIQRTFGWAPVWAVDQPYYLKHAPGNPWFGAAHDGTSAGYGQGFTFKPINWLTRFRWNSQRRGAQPFYLRNPGGKFPHWLEINSWDKFAPHAFSLEGIPHTWLGMAASVLVLWNLTRYIFFHPDLTIYNVCYYSMRQYMNVLRSNDITNLDTPHFRWAQQPSEFMSYMPHREMVALGVAANDPYVEYMKAIGKEELLTHKYGEPGYTSATSYLPQHRWGWSYKEKGDLNPIPDTKK